MGTLNAPSLVGWLAAALIGCAAAAVSAGCAPTPPAAAAAAAQKKGTSFTSVSVESMAAARTQAMSSADTYLTVFVQAMDELRDNTKRPEVAEWAMEQRINTGTAVFTNASGGNDFVALLDMLVLSTLKRHSMEEHWIPALLHEEGAPVLKEMLHGERDVWTTGAKVLTEGQLAELRSVIEQWVKENPGQYYVSHVRFTDFATTKRMTADSPQAKAPGSVFGLLYLDPLAGLDPVARELQQYRALTERILYLTNRLPMVLAWRLELAAYRTVNAPQLTRFNDNTSKFTEVATRFTEVVTRFAENVRQMPANLATERNAAIQQIEAVTTRQVQQVEAATTRQVKSAVDQAMAGVTEQRQAVIRDLEAQTSKARSVIGDVRGVVERADEAGRSVNAATGQTIGVAEQSTRRTLRYAFALAVALVLITLASLLCYRLAVRRWAPRNEALLEPSRALGIEGMPRSRIPREATVPRRGRPKPDD